MRTVRYKQSEYLIPWKWRKRNPLYRFILDIPYALYFSVVPSRMALNEVLLTGSSGGGMGPGLYWEPFEITEDEYEKVIEAWKNFDLRKVLKYRVEDIPDLGFIFDEGIQAIPSHLEYLQRSREKYESRFWKQATR